MVLSFFDAFFILIFFEPQQIHEMVNKHVENRRENNLINLKMFGGKFIYLGYPAGRAFCNILGLTYNCNPPHFKEEQ